MWANKDFAPHALAQILHNKLPTPGGGASYKQLAKIRWQMQIFQITPNWIISWTVYIYSQFSLYPIFNVLTVY